LKKLEFCDKDSKEITGLKLTDFVFDTTNWGYSVPKADFALLKAKLDVDTAKASCTEKKKNIGTETKKVEVSYYECTCAKKLENLPNFKFKFDNP